MNVDTAIATLREKAEQANELQRLRDRVEELEELLGLAAKDEIDMFVWLPITPTQRQILNVLYNWKIVERGKLYTLLYGERLECDQPNEKVIDVNLSKLRNYLNPANIQIFNQRLKGWFMSPEDKEKLLALTDQLRRKGHRR